MLFVTSYENMTLCHDNCVSGCVSYLVPLGTCFSPPQLWPGDPQWGDNDVLDECINASYFLGRLVRRQDGRLRAANRRLCWAVWQATAVGQLQPVVRCGGPARLVSRAGAASLPGARFDRVMT